MECISIPDIEEFQTSSIVKKVPVLTEQLMALLICVDKNKETTPHIHDEADELQYIITGSGKLTVGKTELELSKGMLILVPKSTLHFFSTSLNQLTVMSISSLPEEGIE